jgi:hypothetical protein
MNEALENLCYEGYPGIHCLGYLGLGSQATTILDEK